MGLAAAWTRAAASTHAHMQPTSTHAAPLAVVGLDVQPVQPPRRAASSTCGTPLAVVSRRLHAEAAARQGNRPPRPRNARAYVRRAEAAAHRGYPHRASRPGERTRLPASLTTATAEPRIEVDRPPPPHQAPRESHHGDRGTLAPPCAVLRRLCVEVTDHRHHAAHASIRQAPTRCAETSREARGEMATSVIAPSAVRTRGRSGRVKPTRR